MYRVKRNGAVECYKPAFVFNGHCQQVGIGQLGWSVQVFMPKNAAVQQAEILRPKNMGCMGCKDAQLGKNGLQGLSVCVAWLADNTRAAVLCDGATGPPCSLMLHPPLAGRAVVLVRLV